MGIARLIIMPLFISLVLTCITYFLFVIIDLITNYHTADLLLNVDFVRNYQNITLIEELSYHFLTTFIIVIITIVIYVNFNKLKIIFLTTLFIIFTVLYPILIKMSERDIFQYSLNEHVIWIVGHILFLYLLNIIVTRSYLK